MVNCRDLQRNIQLFIATLRAKSSGTLYYLGLCPPFTESLINVTFNQAEEDKKKSNKIIKEGMRSVSPCSPFTEVSSQSQGP